MIKKILQPILVKYKKNQSKLIPILQETQEKLGYLPREAMVEIARYLNVPESSVFGVATFYAQFRFSPIGKNHVMMCRGTSCHVRGAPYILAEIEKQLGIKEGETTTDMKFSLETVACIGACGLAPNMTINKVTYGHLNTKKVTDIMRKIKKNKKK